MILNKIKVIQHNVLHWTNRRIILSNTYRNIDPEIILINSHCIPDETKIKIAGYNIHKKNTLNNPSDGSAIAIKKHINYKLHDNFLSDLLAIEISTSTGNIIIATMYQPPARNYIPIPDFLTLFRRNIPVYFIGDLNANHPTLGYQHTNTKGRQINRLIRNRTIQHIGPEFPTYYTHGRGTTPDIILANYRVHHNIHVEQGPLTTSDHIPIILTIAASPILIPSSPKPYYKNADWEKFQNIVNTNMWSNTINNEIIETIDEAVENWHHAIKCGIQIIPQTWHKALPAPRHSNTTKLLLILFTNLTRHSRDHGWNYAQFRYYKNIQVILQESLIREKNEQWTKLIKDVTNTYKNPRVFWEKINNIIGNSYQDTHYLKDTNNIKVYTDEGKEQVHREHWEQVFIDDDEEEVDNDEIVYDYLRNNINRITPFEHSNLLRLGTSTIDRTIEIDEVKEIIHKLKRTSPGGSGINKIILNKLPDMAINRLTDIYNNTLSAGYFPDAWKKAIVRLIPKSNKSPYHPQNYRPISLLEVPGKILERIINTRLKTYLEINNKYNINQFGFRAGRGTTHALAIITEKIAQHKSDKGQCQVIFRDVTKAFDKVWHCGLKYKILQLQLPTTIEKILCDFISDRTASIKVKNFIGPSFNLNTGVPQGSVLSPTLYTIYTNDIEESQRDLNISYADDITQIIGYKGKSKNMMNLHSTREIERINNFEKTWKIKTNITKFTPLHLGARITTPLNVNDNPIEFKNIGKCLGLKITNTGYYKHITDRCNSASAALKKLNTLYNMPEKIKVHLVKALILPILDYPPIPIHAMSKTQISKLQKIQNRALRFATNQKYPYSMNTIQIHNHTKTQPVNIRLHKRAKDIWDRLQDLEIPAYQELEENKDNINNYHKDFKSSLLACSIIPTPEYH